ncbi:MAG: NACHT domain-containing protein, partial [Planctomycetota bacterium]
SKMETNRENKSEMEALLTVALALDCRSSDIAVLPDRPNVQITDETILSLLPHILTVAKIKTLIRPEADTDVRDVYYRTALLEQIGDEVRRSKVHSLQDLNHTACIIQGYAGQGKSVLLRHLTIQEATTQQSLPIFIELRRLKGESIRSTVLRRLQNWGVCETDEHLSSLLSSGRISLLLDAFDEIRAEHRQTLVSELADLHDANRSMKIVISSRPGSGITAQQWFHIYSVAELTARDLRPLVQIYATVSEAKQILARLKDTIVPMEKLLNSPLLVVLLVIHFRYTQSIPESTIAFYRDLLDVLLRRHNVAEDGYKRQIQSGLDTFQLRRAFEVVSYVIERDHGDSIVHVSDLENAMSLVLDRFMQTTVPPRLVLDDLMFITNLIIEEGGYCYYVHNSVREFFAAVVIRDATVEQAERFYRGALRSWRRWSGVLAFLLHIDRARYVEFFSLPDLSRYEPFTPRALLGQFEAVEISKHGAEISLILTQSDSPTVGIEQIECDLPRGYDTLHDLFGRERAEDLTKRLETFGRARVPLYERLDGPVAPIFDLTTLVGLLPPTHIPDAKALQTTLSQLKAEVAAHEERESEFDV